MADLSFFRLAQRLPSGAIYQDGDTVLVDLKKLMNESSVSFGDEKVAEFLSKLLQAVANAQDTYNLNTNGALINSYPQPTYSSTVPDAFGNFFVTKVHYVSVFVPLDLDSAVGVTT